MGQFIQKKLPSSTADAWEKAGGLHGAGLGFLKSIKCGRPPLPTRSERARQTERHRG